MRKEGEWQRSQKQSSGGKEITEKNLHLKCFACLLACLPRCRAVSVEMLIGRGWRRMERRNGRKKGASR